MSWFRLTRLKYFGSFERSDASFNNIVEKERVMSATLARHLQYFTSELRILLMKQVLWETASSFLRTDTKIIISGRQDNKSTAVILRNDRTAIPTTLIGAPRVDGHGRGFGCRARDLS